MSDRTAAVERARACMNAGDLDGYLQLYADDVRLHGFAPRPIGKPELAAFYRGLLPGFGSPRLEFHDVLESGDSIAIRYTLSGTHAADLLGVPATGRDIALSGITILRFEGDTVAERWSSADTLGLLVQIGAVPAPA